MESPSSYEHLVHSISARASFREAKYVEIWTNLKEYNSQELNLKGATWHRKCYQEATHSGMIKKIKGEVGLKNKADHERVVIVLYFHRLRISVLRKSQFCSLVMRKLDCLEKTKECFSLLRNFSENM